MWRAVVFDLDDTLFAERDFVLSGFHAVAERTCASLGLAPESGFRELKQLHDAGVRGTTFDRWLSRHDVTRHPAELVEIYRTHRPTIQLFPEIGPLLNRLQSHCRLGIVSDGYSAVQHRKVEALGIGDSFTAIIISDDLGRAHWKPSMLPFTEVLRQLGVAPREAVYVADNPLKDFYGPRAIGMASIWSRHCDGDYCRLSPPTLAYAPDHTVDSVEQLEELLFQSAPARGARRHA